MAIGAAPGVAAAQRLAVVTNSSGDNLSIFPVANDGSLGAPATVASQGTDPIDVAISPDARRAFVSNSDSGTVAAFAIDAAGALTPAGVPVSSGGMQPFGLAVSRDGRRVYAVNNMSNTIVALAVAPDGSLSALGPPIASGGLRPRSVAVTPDGRFAIVSHNTSSDVTALPIAADGTLGAAGPPVAPGGVDTFDVSLSPDGRRGYVANFGTNDAAAFTIAADGTLAPLGAPVPTGGTPPRTIVTTPNGAAAFAANGGASNSIAPFGFAANGSLTSLGTPVAAGASGPQGMAVSPDSRRLYVAANGGQVATFAIAPNGTLTAAGAPVAAGSFPFAVAVTPDQGPVARIAAAGPFVAGRSARLDGRGSTDADGTVARYDWDFGDGTTLTNGGPRPAHTYRRAGLFTVRLRVTDDQGCSDAFVTTGQTASCNGSAVAVTTRAVRVVLPAATATARLLAVARVRPAGGRARIGVGCTTSRAARCTGAVALTRRSGGRVRLAGSGPFSVRDGSRGAAGVVLDGATRRLLARGINVRVTAIARTRQPGGGTRVTSRRTLTLLGRSGGRRFTG